MSQIRSAAVCNECKLDKHVQPCHCKELMSVLRGTGAHPEFRGEQKRAIYSILFGKHKSTVLIAPAGSGKSFVYEAAVRINRDKLRRKQTCLVVGPLRAIIADQINYLTSVNFSCLDWTDRRFKHQDATVHKLLAAQYDFGMSNVAICFVIRFSKCPIVFLCPESLLSFEQHLQDLLASKSIFLVVVDELH